MPLDTEVTFDFQAGGHTVVTNPADAINAEPININNESGDLDPVTVWQKRVVAPKIHAEMK